MSKRLSVVTMVIATMVLATTGCRPKYPACEKDSHCNEGEYCVNKLCQQCRDDGNCPEGQECQDGACREIPGYCSSSSDCSEGQVCRDNRCGPCMSAGDCPEGKVCIDGVCDVAECNDDSECPAGLKCVNYRCKVDEMAKQDSTDCEIEPIYFDFDSAEISQSMRQTLEKNYECLQKENGKVTLEGHTDPRGTTEYNMALGDRRARIVSKVIKTLGMDNAKLRVVSKGEEEATGSSEEGWSKDRRVEFK